ncbi:MAG: hypothetical protein IPG51_13010 [Chloroflexi bacterium]|nr:hypothetical protein [Chloroflexota bacterium]
MFPVTSIDEMRGLPGDVDVFGQPNELALIPADAWYDNQANALDGPLLSIPDYAALFRAAYPLSRRRPDLCPRRQRHRRNFEADAFKQYQSPWYACAKGDSAVLSETEKQGAVLFLAQPAVDSATTARC